VFSNLLLAVEHFILTIIWRNINVKNTVKLGYNYLLGTEKNVHFNRDYMIQESLYLLVILEQKFNIIFSIQT